MTDTKYSKETEALMRIRQNALIAMNAARVEAARAERAYEIADKRYERSIIWDRIAKLRGEIDQLEAKAGQLRVEGHE